MPPLDDTQLYDLSEASRLLFRDPAWLARGCRTGRIPWQSRDGRILLPAPWVEAEAGRSDSDPEALRVYWAERFAPPPPDAARPLRPLDALPTSDTVPEAEAARRLHADVVRLRSLAARGVLPALRIDGESRYDADLLEHVSDGPVADDAASDARREAVAGWAQFEYASSLASAPPAATRAAPPAVQRSAPGAWRLPEDLTAPEEATPGSPEVPPRDSDGLIEAEGYETVDEDD